MFILICFLCGIFADNSKGGPSKPELLALLQNCDICPASRVSSTFSSRAPSPSPSLMSIMYPSIRLPVGGRGGGIPVSPLSTPVLSVSRSRVHADPATGGDNLFQPICISHSNSSTSFDEGVTLKESDEVFTVTPGGLDTKETLVKSKVVAGLQQEQRVTETDEHSRKYGDRKSDVDCCRHKFEVTELGSVHQRSRSNEMEYVSLQSAGERRPRIHSFRSPPGSMQTFKPLGTSCREEIKPPPAQTDPGMGSLVGSCDSPPPKTDDATPLKPRESRSEPREGAEKPDGVLGDQFGLLKEFDPSLWSSSFASLNTRYSDC